MKFADPADPAGFWPMLIIVAILVLMLLALIGLGIFSLFVP